ncbi:metal ABC transporter substrate-binding protein [Candidatus Phytoplasma solani]|uniref:ABC-type Mn/Zn transport system, substrate-binding protein n=1 Tax=Candidatus Phytoplasma solani TaxID=69896 RepID=A0A421NXA5_9MOLU|nr:metal ABC transporter substrate-binding protein [Candidatus Phytoplasma solani]RMI88663.1 ABC-type Mn/Zn transport system, substrate-binding protein [Candidatus Phytoplasma solani]
MKLLINNKDKKISFIATLLIIGITVLILSIPICALFYRQFKPKSNDTKRIVVTTTMLQDLVNHLIGDVNESEQLKNYQKISNIEVKTLMGIGIDPHNYKTKLSDRAKIQEADLVVVNGLNLEAKMPDAFAEFSQKDCLWNAGDKLKEDINFKEELLKKDYSEDYDPHIWFSPDLWIQTLQNLKDVLIAKNIVKEKAKLETNFQIYNEVLTNLKTHIVKEMKDLKTNIEKQQNKFIIVTAHDAFSYWQQFCKKNHCSFDLEPIQGISTQTEASNNKIVTLAKKLAQHNVQAIFTENSMPKNSLKSLKEEVDKQRQKLKMTGTIKIPDNVELYSDSLGTNKHEEKFEDIFYKHSTYVGAFLNNIKIIKENLL